ncbi:hypothetical protein [Nocardioides astragali]|uniref:Uncharacterized protein n=1 Tax=Nocardioides astragali TaxID=1776736 RepID=A0ABW2N279_9ACTN|nr:hypothetical protein [Nocardioides astragali]
MLLTLADGSQAALEVTSHSAEGVQLRDAILGAENNQWPNPGSWYWRADIGSPRDIPELRERYDRIVRYCEDRGITQTGVLYPWEHQDPDIAWLLKSSVELWGSPDLTTSADGSPYAFEVLPPGGGGAVDVELAGLASVIEAVLSEPNQVRHIDKLNRATGMQKHLFLILGEGALPFEQWAGLMRTPPVIPTVPLTLSPGLDVLWFVSSFSHNLYRFGSSGWEMYPLP